MSNPDSKQESAAEEEHNLLDDGGLLEDGWGDGDDGGFASEHTTVDPMLLEKLAALDEKEKAEAEAKEASSGPAEASPAVAESADASAPDSPQPPSSDKTMTLDISDFDLSFEEEDEEEESAPEPEPEPESEPEPTIEVEHSISSTIEVDQEFAEEKTQIFVSAMEDEPTKAKLRVIQGGGQQKEYLLARDRVTLGRGTNNDILVPDIAISRQHCEIKRISDGQYRLGDMQSGNGTKLNGSRVIDADLFGGDRIEIGSTILEFVLTGPGASRPAGERRINYHPSEVSSPAPAPSRPPRPSAPVMAPAPSPRPMAPAPAPAPVVPNYSAAGSATSATAHYQAPPQKNSNALITAMIAVFALVFLSLAAIIGAKIVLDSQQDSGQQVESKPASAYYAEGTQHVKDRDWEKAEEKFTIASDLAKEERAFQIGKDAKLRLELVRKEINNNKSLKRGKALLDKGDYVEAITRLNAVRSGSVYYDESRTLLDKAKTKYARSLVDKGNKALDDKKYADAEKAASQALETSPDFEPALALQKKIAELPNNAYERKKPAAVARNTNPGRSNAGRKPNPGRNTKPKTNNDGGGETAKPAPVAVPPKETTPTAVANNNKPASNNTGGSGGSAAPTKKTNGVANFTPGLGMYRNKKYSDAIAFFKNIEATDDGFSGRKAGQLAKNIASFQSNYSQGTSAFSSKNYSGAVRFLSGALRLDKSISGTGYHGAGIRSSLAESHYQLALAALNNNNHTRAGVHAKKVLVYNRAHAGNQQMLQRLERKGKSMFSDAFNKKKSDPNQARRIVQTIIAMLPDSSETNKRARKLLKDL